MNSQQAFEKVKSGEWSFDQFEEWVKAIKDEYFEQGATTTLGRED